MKIKQSFLLRRNKSLIVALLLVVNIVIGLGVVRVLGYDLEQNPTWDLARQGLVPPAGTYSPIPSLIVQVWMRLFSDTLISTFLFKFLLVSASAYLVYKATCYLFKKDHKIATLSVVFMIISPYLIWSLYVGRDVDLDVFSVALLMFFAIRFYTQPTLHSVIGIALAGAFAALIRESNVLLLPCLIIYFIILKISTWRQAVISLGIFILGMLPLLVWNFSQIGSVTLTTRFGYNLYIGNHPDYMAGHPDYDIDVFMMERMQYEYDNQYFGRSGVFSANNFWMQKAIDNILERPIETVHRAILKTGWWMGIQRIPGTDTHAVLDVQNSTIHIFNRPSSIKDILYIIHRIIVLIGVLIYWKSGIYSRRLMIFLLLPILIMLPVVVLTFPDTRFRLAYDPYTYILAAAGYYSWFNKYKLRISDKIHKRTDMAQEV